MNIDLNENNYDYDKLLNLFSLDYDFNEEDLKRCKIKVLKIHPDKSKLDPKYFVFFFKMYKKLIQIYDYVNHEKDIHKMNKEIDIEDHFKRYLESKNIDPRNNFVEFSKEFNKMFDKVYINENDDGCDDWLKSEEGMFDKNNLEKSREKLIQENSLVQKTDFEELESANNLFGKFQYHDIKESHGKPIFDMDVNKEISERRTFKNVQEYQMFLKSEDKKNQPMGLQQSNSLLKQRENMLNSQAKNIAYQNMRHQEKTKIKYNNYVSNYLQLE